MHDTNATSLNVLRTDISRYQSPNYIQKEKEKIESLGLNYKFQACNEFTPDILITNTHTRFDELEKKINLKKIKLIIHPNSGYDNFTPCFLERFDFPIILGNEIRAKNVFNYILACFYHAFSYPPFKKQWDPRRKWSRKPVERLNIQLYGYGHIGKLVYKSLKENVKNIWIYDPYEGYHQKFIEQSDAIIFCCSLNAHNQYMCDKSFFERIQSSTVLINAARGKLINFDALTNYLSKNLESKAYIDVFETEPYPLETLENLTNLFTSSHIAGVSFDLDEKILSFCLNVLRDYLISEEISFMRKYSHVLIDSKYKNNQLI